MARILSDHVFEEYSRLVYEQSGIYLDEGKKALLQSRLNRCLRNTGIDTYEAYYRYITSPAHLKELANFLDCISTNLTYFFREPQHFEYLDRAVLPELLRLKEKESCFRIRVWSAGCSTGEEPYSLAMSIHSHLDDPEKWDFRILGTDISTRVLDIAARGVYAREKMENVPALFQRLYFRKHNRSADEYEIVPELRRIVAYHRLNFKDLYPLKGSFDFIFCRNVMIYFDKPTQETLINRIVRYLPEGGHLFVGHCESLAGLKHSLTFVRPAVYRK